MDGRVKGEVMEQHFQSGTFGLATSYIVLHAELAIS